VCASSSTGLERPAKVLAPKFDRIPLALRDLDQWVLWRLVYRGGPKRLSKVPFQPNGKTAKSNDPATWSTFDAARAAYEAGGYDGVMFAFSDDDPYCGIDLDGCLNPETNEWETWVEALFEHFTTYAELSPSRTGVKLFGIGRPNFSGNRKLGLGPVGGKEPGVEVYDQRRFFVVTGRRLPDVPHESEDVKELLAVVKSRYWEPAGKPGDRASPAATPGVSTWAPGYNPVEWSTPAKLEETKRRCSAYVEELAAPISGNSGHNKLYRACCVVYLLFAVDRAIAVNAENR
jgi:hypothetical protein